MICQRRHVPLIVRITVTMVVADNVNVDQLVTAFRQYVNHWEQQRAIEQTFKRTALSGMIVHSGFTFEGYKITKYSGYISGDSIVQVDRGSAGLFSSAANVGAHLTHQLVNIRRGAIAQLKEAAYDLGCNAVVGVDFDYIALEPETATSGGGTMYLPYVFAVTAHGSGVVIEKN
jgi:uncharacterized protein YbjQ (UPF0145 family)